MVTIARWSHAGAQRTGFVHDGRYLALPDVLGTQDLFEMGLEATLELAARTVGRRRRTCPPWARYGCLPLWFRAASGTS